MLFHLFVASGLCDFTFSTGKGQKFTLSSEEKPLNALEFFQKSTSSSYYYVFMKNSESALDDFKKIGIEASTKNMLNPNLFKLFLTREQASLLLKGNYSLVKKIERQDKILIDRKLYKAKNQNHKTNNQPSVHFLAVNHLHSFKIPSRPKLYEIYSTPTLSITLVRPLKLKKAVNYLSSIPEVSSISETLNLVSKNVFAAGFTQNNDQKLEFDENSQNSFAPRFLNEKGITGKGEVISIIDSSIDYHHAMFYDDENNFGLDKELPNHRKFTYYYFEGTQDDLDQSILSEAHGTHIAGILAGNNKCSHDFQNNFTIFDGIAPEAKLFYAGNHSSGRYVQKPIKEYADKVRELGSHIAMNSWGSQDGFDSVFNNIFTEAAQEHPDILFLFAAGNERDSIGYYSVCDPAGSSNVLAIGSSDEIYDTQSLEMSFILFNAKYEMEATLLEDWTINNPGLFLYLRSFHDIGAADFLIIDPNDYVSNEEFCEVANTTQYSIIVDNNPENYSCSNLSGIAAMLVSKEDIDNYTKFDEDMIITMRMRRKTSSLKSFSQIRSAPFSSIGPANRGLKKPDLIAPGTNIFSAYTNEINTQYSCSYEDSLAGYILQNGTSMSTPNVAGAAALVRQFFREGLWSNGNSSDNQTIDLTATQMRALLIASAKRPDNSRTPDSIIGHGLVDLSTILSFDNRFGVRITPSDNPQIHPKSHIVSKLTVNKEKYANSHSLSVTLAYLDKPIDIDSAYPLFADIDLVVISPKGNKFFGNDLPNKDGEHLSTNEKVIIDGDDLIDGEYEIHLITDSQTSADYSVVAVGPFSNGFLEFYDIQQDDKNQTCGCNECENGFCKCDKLHTGSFCQVDVIQVNNFDLFQVHVLGSSFAYLYVPLKGNVIFNISRPDSPHGNLSYVFYSPEKKLSISNFLYSRSLDEIETQMKIEEVTDDGFYMALFNNHPMPRDFNLFFRGFDKEEMSDAELYGIIGGSIAGAIVGVFLCIVSCCKKVRNFFVQKCCCCCLKKDHDHIQISSDNGIKNELMMDEE